MWKVYTRSTGTSRPWKAKNTDNPGCRYLYFGGAGRSAREKLNLVIDRNHDSLFSWIEEGWLYFCVLTKALQCIYFYLRGIGMKTTNLNIRTEIEIKEQAGKIYSELGLNMTTAINMFLKASIRDNGIPFELKLDYPNDVTASAIEDGRRIAKDNTVKKYSSIVDLRDSLGV